MKKLLLSFTIIFFTNISFAQGITGTWEGDLGGDEFLQVNIIQIKGNVCGYTWDYNYLNKKDYCKAYFNGNYNETTKTIYFSGYSFMQNSGGHILIQLKASLTVVDGKTALRGYCRTAPSLLMPGGYPMEVQLFKTSNRPTIITQPMIDCEKLYKAEQKANEKLLKKPNLPRTILPKPTVPKDIPTPPKPSIKPSLKKDSLKKTTPVIIKKDTPLITTNTYTPPQTINGRKNKEQIRIVLNERNITLELYDNGTIDGDAVSIYYNGKKIVDNKKLSTVPIKIELKLDENTNIHSLVMYAENLGTIPPNTALIIVTTPSKKRYELYSSATLQQNAELVFEYKEK